MQDSCDKPIGQSVNFKGIQKSLDALRMRRSKGQSTGCNETEYRRYSSHASSGMCKEVEALEANIMNECVGRNKEFIRNAFLLTNAKYADFA